jgi:hypothetical protein
MADNIVTPVGRFVSGSLTEKKKTDYQQRPIPYEKQRFEFGVAFRKDDADINAVLQYVQGVAMTQHAHLPAVQNFQLDGYSWKIKDGDKPNSEGEVSENTRECWILYFSTGFPPNTCDSANAQIPSENIKRGYYVDIVMNAANNGAQGAQAGVYLNPVWLRLVAFGEEIRGGIDASTAFGGAQPGALPPGASAAPLPTSAPAQIMTQSGNVALNAVPTAAPQPVGQPGLPTASPSNPAHDFVDNAAPRTPGLPT